ncbi:unnamed protein product [Orchesella dallaii]|uniref:Uncharacterized protein n=1 Tax=Orchesella dallaii TaxID=48710 RepID=A0ABP1RYD5_9HEXA
MANPAKAFYSVSKQNFIAKLPRFYQIARNNREATVLTEISNTELEAALRTQKQRQQEVKQIQVEYDKRRHFYEKQKKRHVLDSNVGNC